MLMLVFAIKGALVPLHFWLPATYANAPGVVAALFAVMTKVGAYAALRFGTLVFPTDLAVTGTLIADLMLPAGLMTLALGSIGILGAQSLPRLAAYAAHRLDGHGLHRDVGLYARHPPRRRCIYMMHSTLAGAALFLIVDLVQARAAHSRYGARPAAPAGPAGGAVSWWRPSPRPACRRCRAFSAS